MRPALLATALLLSACSALKPEVPRCGDCPDQAGQMRCLGGSLDLCNLESPTSDCYSWQRSPCGAGFTCQAEPPACVTTCPTGHVCVAGATRCTGDGLQQACGLVGGCLAWLTPAACPGGGACDCEPGTTRCTADGRQQACGPSSGCPTWQAAVSCQAGAACPADRDTCQPFCLAGAIASAAPGRAPPACALLAGRAWCWGRDEAGQLGDGAIADLRGAPVLAAALGDGLAELALLSGGGTTCARTAAGEVRCVGSNAAGALGAGSDLEGSTAALTVGAIAGATRLAAGSGHACALLQDGSVRCWGAGEWGQLGDASSGGTHHRSSPATAVGLASGVERLDCGGLACCARLAGGEVRCWGYVNSLFSTATPLPPFARGALAGADQVALTRAQLCARFGGEVRCAGANARGSLGDGTRDSRGDLLPVQGLSGAVALAAATPDDPFGGTFCAALASGALRCWGAGAAGTLLPGDALVPVEVAVPGGAVTALAGHLFAGTEDGTWWRAGAAWTPVTGCR